MLDRRTVRRCAALAAVAFAVASIGIGHARNRAVRAAERVRPALTEELARHDVAIGDPVYLRIFKEERELELWMRDASAQGSVGFRLVKTYPICAFSGRLGPKQKQGDLQAPEGFYTVRRGQLNPASSYHLSFDLGYPNAYDRAHGRTGNYLMVHGNCVSVGCYAMGDAAIEEIYTLVAAALERGQDGVPVHAFPFRFDAARTSRVATSEWAEFWTALRAGYDTFEATKVPPRVAVRERRYVIGAP